jgi:hypothetical protein
MTSSDDMKRELVLLDSIANIDASACIGDASDGYHNGVITHTNARAAAMGVGAGMAVEDLVRRLSG